MPLLHIKSLKSVGFDWASRFAAWILVLHELWFYSFLLMLVQRMRMRLRLVMVHVVVLLVVLDDVELLLTGPGSGPAEAAVAGPAALALRHLALTLRPSVLEPDIHLQKKMYK